MKYIYAVLLSELRHPGVPDIRFDVIQQPFAVVDFIDRVL